MIGQTISHYKITAKLGEGGMGVVYRAEDTKLKRPVALKFIAANLIKDAEARKRFEREAKAAAGVSHANVCHVYEIADADGHTFLAMEFVEGEGLDKKIERGPLPLKDALDLASQAAKGLAVAHSRGVVHRDIKPANLLVSTDGELKILDFGLALLTEGSKLTQLDAKVGTVAYMSPEQAQGAEVDHRSDIWSLGCVLYEMVCGQRPFRGAYDQALLYEIINQEIEPLTGVRAGVPMELEWIVGKCLAKEPDTRYRHADELAGDLKNLQDKLKSGRSTILRTSFAPGVPAVTTLAQPPQPGIATLAPIQAEGVLPLGRKLRLLQALIGLLALTTVAIAFVHFRESPPDRPVYEFAIPLAANLNLHTFSVSPDGRHVAIAADRDGGRRQLYVRSIDSRDLRPLPGTEEAQYPFWSPDSRYLGFFAQSKLKKTALAGGPPQTLCDALDGRGGSWNSDGVIIFSPAPFAGKIERVPDSGGSPTTVLDRGESLGMVDRRFPWFLPDGNHFTYSFEPSESADSGIYLSLLDGAENRRLLSDRSNTVFAAGPTSVQGHLLFQREGALVAQPFDAGRLELSGEAFPVAPMVGLAANLSNYGFSASSNGLLVYLGKAHVPDAQLAWYDAMGKQLETVGKPAQIRFLSLSPDERKVALGTQSAEGHYDGWILDLVRGSRSVLSPDPSSEVSAMWSPDGARIVFTSQRARRFALFETTASGVGEEIRLLPPETAYQAIAEDWSRDGKFLLFARAEGATSAGRNDLWVLPRQGDPKPFPFLQSEFSELGGKFSPDGRWVAYTSNESGRDEVYIRPFPAADRKWQVSTHGGASARWRGDGKMIYFIAPDRKLMAATIAAGDSIEAGVPEALFETRLPQLFRAFVGYDVSADGRRFLLANETEAQGGSSLVVITNWSEKFGK